MATPEPNPVKVVDHDAEEHDKLEDIADNIAPAPAFFETLHKASTRAINLWEEPAAQKEKNSTAFLATVRHKVSKGAGKAGGAIKSGANAVASGVGNTATDLASFFKHLALTNKAEVEGSEPGEVPELSEVTRVEPSDASRYDSEVDHAPATGIYGVDYQRYPIGTYVRLPAVLQPFLGLPGLDHILCVARPTMDKSAGLDGYRTVTEKAVRARAPFLIVVDERGKNVEDKKYVWLEVPLVDVFKLDVGQLKSMDDYVKKLSKKGKWNFKDRQKKFNDPSKIKCEYVKMGLGNTALCDTLWPLYAATGKKNGFCVLSKDAFYDFHTKTPDLTLMSITDVRDPDSPKLITFCTGVRAGDTLMPMWCGTDYDNDLQRVCSTYFNMLYEFVRVAIADPDVKWVDLGATRRTAKTSIGFDGYPVSAYVRCKNSVMLAIVEAGMEQFFSPEDLMNDP